MANLEWRGPHKSDITPPPLQKKNIYNFPEELTIHSQFVNISPEAILILQNTSIHALFIDFIAS